MALKTISLKYSVSGMVQEFLDDEKMECPHTHKGVVSLINLISTYKEEGKALFPEVYIVDNLSFLQRSLINCETIRIGRAECSERVILKALKKCAPLSFGGWSIYILRDNNEFEYGLFRSGATIITVPTSQSIIEDGDNSGSVFLIRQVSDKIVEVKGVKGSALIINFGIRSTSDLSPLDEQARFINKVIERVEPNIKDQTRIFLSRLFLYVMQNGHGNLSLVVSSGQLYPDYLQDGIVLQQRVSFAERIADLTRASAEDGGLNLLEANSRLNGVFNLIAGMMLSDGITVFCNDGSVLAYNIFLKHPVDQIEQLANVEGGARSRTYEIMKQKLSEAVVAVYVQSQDGKTQTQI